MQLLISSWVTPVEFELHSKSKYFNVAESACLMFTMYVLTPEPSTEGTVQVSPFLLQIDTFGKLLGCLTKVCYLKLKKSESGQTQLRPLLRTRCPGPGLLDTF